MKTIMESCNILSIPQAINTSKPISVFFCNELITLFEIEYIREDLGILRDETCVRDNGGW